MREKIKMVSTGLNKAGKRTGTFRTTKKNKRKSPDKLRKKCFDARAYNTETGKAGMHVIFEEGKI